ncbi:outer membrane protein assembly factor BamA [Brytella acorum]|uniref:Outer membrane protein assembly factor BamA n=1 Tax=Brytella acorum TaxID=2959299 RepID=A0AA35UGC2_9PROT|nr:outer membrane protein assembly factor BamA [Brytella acorum]MDF3625553.1 outer membrane protein assembly factor BamA [Brytella acorum]CAI9119420.1 outer membrane protein assembly factor BamA [Brytella acorum]
MKWGTPVLSGKRLVLLASACLAPLFVQGVMVSEAAAQAPHRHRAEPARQVSGANNRIEAITVNGNSRIETSTVMSYMVVQPGDSFNQENLDRSLKTLYATGLFKDVTLRREGSTLIVDLVENPIVNRIAFEGNSAIKDEDLRKEIAMRPRAVYSEQAVAADRKKLLDLYASKARFGATVTPQIINLSHKRVDVVFKINEARQTLINKIAFVGNSFFSEARLASVISSKETEWYRFFSSSDEYNPERVKYDAELLRRFYLHNGFVDFHMINATGELSPDRKTFYVTFTFSEGERYRIGRMDVRSSLRHVDSASLKNYPDLFQHQWYDGTAIQNNATGMQERLQAEGHPFAMVRPVIARNPEKKVVNLLFDVTEGPKVYVERIDINGNTITQDKVLRRQLPMAEGDPYTPADKKYSKMILEDLGYFKTVSVDQAQGSSADRVNVSANVVEKPTGEFSLGGGYSTDVGVLGNIALKQHNLLGTGVDAGISGTVAYYEKQVDLAITDPYFLDRNLVAGIDIFGIQNNYMTYQSYKEGRFGATLRLGYSYNRYLSQSWSYSIIDRDVGSFYSLDEASTYGYEYVPSIYVQQSRGWSVLSQLSSTMTYDRRDNRTRPHKGFVVNVAGDVAGLGGDTRYIRGKVDAAYYVPLDSLTGSHDWTLQFKAGAGYMADWGHGNVNIIDNFYLGGENLRGFLQGGVGPRSGHYIQDGKVLPAQGQEDLIGGRFIYTASAQLNFPLPMGDDVGISGRGFIDAGSVAGLRVKNRYTDMATDGANYTPVTGDTMVPRVSGGLGISWKSPFGLVNIDGALPILKSRNDRLYPLRFGFGQQF